MALTRTAVVQAALDVLDADGIDAVTVRAVAGRLGVKAPALYWHVRNKQELLDEMGTEIQRRILAALPPPSADWARSLRAYAHAMRGEFLLHRDGARTFSGTRLTDPELLRAQEPLLAAWTDSGLPLDTAVETAELVTAFVTGFVIEEQERSQSSPDRYDLEVRTDAIGDGHPLVAQAGRVLAGDTDARFDRHLDRIVAGTTAALDG